MKSSSAISGIASASILALAFGACTVGPDPDPDWAKRPSPVIATEMFGDHAKLLDGFDDPRPASKLHKGDRVLYGLRLERHGRKRDWFVSVEVADPEFKRWQMRSGKVDFTLLADVRVHDETGKEIGHDAVHFSRNQLVHGLARACSRASADQGPASQPALRRSDATRAWASLASMLRIIRKSKVLRKVFWQVIDKPSIWSVIVNLGVKVRLNLNLDAIRLAESFPIGSRTAQSYELPVELRINNAPALRCKFFVTDPDSPLNLCAGVLAITAHRPREPGTVLWMRLLAARRASDTSMVEAVTRAKSK